MRVPMRNPFDPPANGGPRRLFDLPTELVGGPKDGETMPMCLCFGQGEYGAPKWDERRRKLVARWIRPRLEALFGKATP